LHVLRGLAVAYEDLGASVHTLSEVDLESAIDDFYAREQDAPYVEDGVESVSIGSSLALLRELNELQGVLGLQADMGELGQEAFERLVSEHQWPTAAHVWGVLRWYARESAGKKLFIQFC
jgi:hypothetical protein